MKDFTAIVIPDVHIPYHDVKAFELVCTVIEDRQPHYVVVMGDFADFYSVSSHSKDPRRIQQLDEEIEFVRENLRFLESCAPNAHKIFIHGNHENRLERYLEQKAPELYTIFKKSDIMGLREHGWKEVPYKDSIKIGTIHFTHDVGKAGIHSTWQSLKACQHNIIIGHNHRMNYHVSSNTTGTQHVGASFGWLGDVDQIDYMHKMVAKSNWVLGFGWLRHSREDQLTIPTPVPIINYTCWVEGTRYKV